MKLDYFYVFWQSNLIEVVVYYLCYRSRLGFGRVFSLVTFANAITHPAVFFGFLGLGLSFRTGTLLAEGFAIVVEGLLDWRFGGLPLGRALTGSTLANLASWQLAPALTYLVFF